MLLRFVTLVAAVAAGCGLTWRRVAGAGLVALVAVLCGGVDEMWVNLFGDEHANSELYYDEWAVNNLS